MVEYRAFNLLVVGSSPTKPIWSHRLAVRTLPFQGGDTGSNPVGTIDNPLPLWYDCLIGTIAQLVEHTPDKGAVTGSSPVGSIPP